MIVCFCLCFDRFLFAIFKGGLLFVLQCEGLISDDLLLSPFIIDVIFTFF